MGVLGREGRETFSRSKEVGSMFETLDERMKHDDDEVTTKRERLLKWLLVGVVAVVLFSGLYMGVRLLG
jgi:hypothetical protein